MLSSSDLQLQWEEPLEEERNGVITGYQLRLEREGGELRIVREQEKSHLFTQLKDDTTYYYSVAACTVKGTGPYSDREMVTTTKGIS